MFLSEQRRSELMRSLMALSMPKHIATLCVGYGSDLQKLDRILANIVGRLGERLSRIRQATMAGDREAQHEHETFLKCDLLIFECYRDAIAERQLPARMFPHVNAAITRSLEEAEQSKRLILKVMGQTGAVH